MGSAKPAVEETEPPQPAVALPGGHSPRRLTILHHARFRRVLAGVAVALAGLVGLWWLHYRPFVSTDDARVAAPIIVIAPQGSGGRVDRVYCPRGANRESQ